MACENDKCDEYGMHHEYKDGIEVSKCQYCKFDIMCLTMGVEDAMQKAILWDLVELMIAYNEKDPFIDGMKGFLHKWCPPLLPCPRSSLIADPEKT